MSAFKSKLNDSNTIEIKVAGDYNGVLDCASPGVVSQQLWALLGGLVKADATTKRTFANVVGTVGSRRCDA